MKQEEIINITIPLQVFVDSHLGRRSDGNVMWFARPINKNIAEIIFLLTGNKHTCYIQWDDEFSIHLREPLLWDYGAWLKHSDRHTREQAYSQKQRDERFILEANVKLLSKEITAFLGIDGEHSRLLAYKMLLHNQKGKISLIAPSFKQLISIKEIA